MDTYRLYSLLILNIVTLSNKGVSSESEDISPFIVGGSNARDEAYPWQLSFQRRGKGGWSHTCGAVLIAEKFALTASHCVYNRTERNPDGSFPSYRVPDMRAVAGALRISSPVDSDVEVHYFKRVFTPYGLSIFFDVALIEFDVAANTNRSDISPITIANETEPTTTGNCMISGWGTIDRNTPRAHPLLREARTKLVSLDECRLSGWGVAPTHVCASGVSKSATGCFGDSGGPLTCYRDDGTPVLMGISSFVYGNCRTSRPNVFSRASIYRKWLQRLTQIDNL